MPPTNPPTIDGTKVLESFDSKVAVSVFQASPYTLEFNDNDLTAHVSNKLWWDFIQKVHDINLSGPVHATFCDFGHRTVLIAEAYLRKDDKKDTYFLNTNFRVVRLTIPEFLSDWFKIGGMK